MEVKKRERMYPQCTGEHISDIYKMHWQLKWNCKRFSDQSAVWLLVEKEFNNILKSV